MNLAFDREFIAQIVIVSAVCAGAWLMFVQPKSQELARLEGELETAASTNALASPEGIESLAGKLQSIKARLAEINRRNATAEDTSVLYAAIMNLAVKREVSVQAVQPSPLKELSKGSPIRTARLDITVAGRFDRVSRFLDDVAGIEAFIRPMSLQLMPIDGQGEDMVSARFGCDVLTFSTAGVLAASEAIAAGAAGANSNVKTTATGGTANGQS